MKRVVLAGLSTLALATAFSLPAKALEQPIAQINQGVSNKQADPQDEQEQQELIKELDAMFEQKRQEMMAEMNAQLDQMHQEMVNMINARYRQAAEQRLNR